MLGKICFADVVGIYDFSAVGFFDAGDNSQQRRFSRAVDADEADFLPFVYAQADILQKRLFGVAFIYLHLLKSSLKILRNNKTDFGTLRPGGRCGTAGNDDYRITEKQDEIHEDVRRFSPEHCGDAGKRKGGTH